MLCEGSLPFKAKAVIHMGACSSTTERDADYLMENNFHYTCALARWAVAKKIPFHLRRAPPPTATDPWGFPTTTR